MKKYVFLQETTETLYNLYSLTYPSFTPFTGKIHFHSPVSLALAISTVAIQLYGSLIDIKILPPSYQLWLNSWLIEKKALYGEEIEQAFIRLLELHTIPNVWFCSTNILLSWRYAGVFKYSELSSLLFAAIECNMRTRINKISTTYFSWMTFRNIVINRNLVSIPPFKDVYFNGSFFWNILINISYLVDNKLKQTVFT